MKEMYAIGVTYPAGAEKCRCCSGADRPRAVVNLNAACDLNTCLDIDQASPQDCEPYDRKWPEPYGELSRVGLCEACAYKWMGVAAFMCKGPTGTGTGTGTLED
ncbi:hypothetical protein TrLO_g6746 [Triparma laevis f. longispina]|uniref:Uncharacterized protein n=1 Tax=Triparma laevis f. longispina TaxID=1714387 RepID=A0A9W7FDU1_9STRA|nr:hypothetical protein TrLO_g6746 [Triparma laevis f. longispina]